MIEVKETREELGEFFDFLYQETEGWVYAPTIEDKSLTQHMFEWPQQRDDLIEHTVSASAQGVDTFVSPALFETKEGRGKKSNVKGSWVLWADFDSDAPEQFHGRIPEPTVRVQSSIKGREHHYWLLDSFLDSVSAIEKANRSIAYAFEADTSGWDASQFLRPPSTLNTGRGKPNREGVQTRRITDYGDSSSLAVFDSLPAPRDTVAHEILESLRPWSLVLATNKWSEEMITLFQKKVSDLKGHDRSNAMMSLAYQAAEAGFSDADIYVMLLNVDERWRKYADRDPEARKAILIKMVSQARAKVGYVNDGQFDSLAEMVKEAETAPLDSGSTKIRALYFFNDFIEEEFKFEWVLENLVTAGGWGVITGSPGVGKTQFAMQMARDLSLGKPFMQWPTVGSEKRVLFLSLEMTAPPFQLFLKHMAKEHSSVELEVLNKNLAIAPLGVPIPLSEERGQDYLDGLIERHKPDVVVIDSLQKVLTGSMTDPEAVRAFNNYLSRHVRKKHGCAVVAIHHNRKKQSDTPRASDLDDMFGNTFLSADLDFAVNMRLGVNGKTIHVDQTKARLSAVTPSFDIERTEHLGYKITNESGANQQIGGEFSIGGFGEQGDLSI